MFKVALKGVLAHKGRVLTTAIAVMLGVAFVTGTLVLSDTVLRVFDDLFADVNAGTDAVVRAESQFSDDFGTEIRGRIDAGLLAPVLGTDGVADAEGQVQGFAQFVDEDGEPIGNPGQGAPTLGFSWPEIEDLNPFEIAEGERPRGPSQVAMDRGTAEKGDFVVGDTVEVLTQNGHEEFELTAIVTFGTADSPAGASVALFDIAAAQRLIAEPGKFDAVVVVAEDGTTQERGPSRPRGDAGRPGGRRGPHGHRDHRGDPRSGRRAARVLHHLPARVRHRGSRRRSLRHLQHVRDPGGPARTRAGPAPGHRRVSPPGRAFGADRSDVRGRHRLAGRPRARHPPRRPPALPAQPVRSRHPDRVARGHRGHDPHRPCPRNDRDGRSRRPPGLPRVSDPPGGGDASRNGGHLRAVAGADAGRRPHHPGRWPPPGPRAVRWGRQRSDRGRGRRGPGLRGRHRPQPDRGTAVPRAP